MGEQNKVMIGDKCAEIYTYESQDLVYAMNWSVSTQKMVLDTCSFRLLRPAAHDLPCFMQNRRDKKFRLAVGSFIEELNNRVEIITCNRLCMTGPSADASKADLELFMPLQWMTRLAGSALTTVYSSSIPTHQPRSCSYQTRNATVQTLWPQQETTSEFGT